MKNTTALLLLSLGLALSSCGGGNTAPTNTGTAISADDQPDKSDDEAVSEHTFNFSAEELGLIQPQSLEDNPLSVTVGVYRSKSGKYKGFSRAKATFNNTTGQAVTGNVHLELGPADKPSELSGPAYDNAKYKIPGAKKTAYTPYNAPLGRQCARINFDLTLSNGKVISVARDSPLSVCDVENEAWWTDEKFAIEYGKHGHATFPMLQISREYGMKSLFARAEFVFWPDQLTPPTAEETLQKLQPAISIWGSTYAKPQYILTGDFDKGYNALLVYGGECLNKSKPFYVCNSRDGKKAVEKNRTNIKNTFKPFEAYNTLGKRLYGYRYPAYKKDVFDVMPTVNVFTTTGPFGTIALYILNRAGNDIDPEYFRNLDSGEDYKPIVSVNDIDAYASFAPKVEGESYYPSLVIYQSSDTKGAVNVANAAYSVKPLASCGAPQDGHTIKSGSFKPSEDPMGWNDSDTVIPLQLGLGLEYSIDITDPLGGKKTLTGSGC